MEQFEKELIEKFLYRFSDKVDLTGLLLISSADVKNWLLMENYDISFRRFNSICGNACMGRTTKNKYHYSIKLLYAAVKQQVNINEIVNDRIKRFKSQSGLALINYYGNKHYWAKEYKKIFAFLSKDSLRLVDVFTGSGVLALLSTEYFPDIYMNDRDSHLINFHRCMASTNKNYLKMLSYIVTSSDITKDDYMELQDEFRQQHYYREVQSVKAAKYFLFREFSWNAIGGYKNKVRELKKITPAMNYTKQYYEKITGIFNYSFHKFLIPYIDDPKTVILCDPPYQLELRYAQREQYEYEFSTENHKQLLRLIRKATAKVILCCYVDMNNIEQNLYYRYLLQNNQKKSIWHLLKFNRQSKHGKKEFIFVNFSIDGLMKTQYFIEITGT